MRHTIIVLLTVLVLIFPLVSTAQSPGVDEKKAVSAADKWLKLVDDGEYDRSWETSAEYLKDAVEKGLWERQLSAVRKPLGASIRRKVKSTKYFTALPGAPDGEYVVIQYETSFENKKGSVETVTPMKEKDGVWRVSGYFIK